MTTTAEFLSRQAAIAKILPEQAFGICFPFAQRSNRFGVYLSTLTLTLSRPRARGFCVRYSHSVSGDSSCASDRPYPLSVHGGRNFPRILPMTPLK